MNRCRWNYYGNEENIIMLDEIKVEFSDFTKIYSKDNKCLVASVGTGDCIFISKEIVDIFKRGESERFTFRELFDCVEDLDSRNLLRNMAEKLDNLNMWKYNKKNITALRQNKPELFTKRHSCVNNF